MVMRVVLMVLISRGGVECLNHSEDCVVDLEPSSMMQLKKKMVLISRGGVGCLSHSDDCVVDLEPSRMVLISSGGVECLDHSEDGVDFQRWCRVLEPF